MTKLSFEPSPLALFFGVDVASKHLDAAQYGGHGVKRLKNSAAAITAWLDKLPPGSIIALESTGRYHQLLATLAHERGFVVYLLNPRDVRHYARGMGMRGKTDRLDAQILARYVAHEYKELRPWQPQPPEQEALDNLLRRRAVVVKASQMLTMSAADSRDMKALNKPAMKGLSDVLTALDQRIAAAAAIVNGDTQDFQRITSVPGIGLLTGSALLGLFRRLANRGGDAVIAFLGLDPRPMDSGQKAGLRRLSKRGPAEWRRLLFNAAMSASKTKAWAAHYARECAKLPRTAALNVLARKMVRVAFGLFKTQSKFDASVVAIK